MTSRLPLALLAGIFLFLFEAPAAALSSPQFWEPAISRALISRDDYYRKVGLELHPISLPFLVDQEAAAGFEIALKAGADSSSPWYHFLSGAACARTSVAQATAHFTQAVSLVNGSPGMVWVLFVEFRRANQYQWAETCLKQLESLFLAEGAQSSPLLSQALLAAAFEEAQRGDKEHALSYCDWSARFDRNSMWPALVSGIWYFPAQPLLFARCAARTSMLIWQSWPLQIKLVFYLVRWLRLVAAFFVGVVFVLIFAKNAPNLLRWMGSLFPPQVPRHVQVILSLAIIASFLLLGIAVFVLIVSLFLWRRAYPRDRRFLAACMALAVLGLAGSVLDDMFVRVLSPSGSFAAVRQAIDEGYSPELEEKTALCLTRDPNDYLADIAMATVLLKKNDALGALSYAAAAQKCMEEDPLVLLTAGNACYGAGKIKAATMYYRRCIDDFPGYEAAYYNLARCNQVLSPDAGDSTLLGAAMRANPASVSRFVTQNKEYFGSDAPVARQIMPADYHPLDFWRCAHPQANELAKRLRAPLTAAYHGIPVVLLGTIAVLLVLLVVLLFQRWWRSRFENTPTGLQGMRIVMRGGSFLDKNDGTMRYLYALMEIVFPGSSDLVRVRRGQGAATVLLFCSSIVWGTYFAVAKFSFAYPHSVVREPFQVLFYTCLLYGIVGAARALAILVARAKT